MRETQPHTMRMVRATPLRHDAVPTAAQLVWQWCGARRGPTAPLAIGRAQVWLSPPMRGQRQRDGARLYALTIKLWLL